MLQSKSYKTFAQGIAIEDKLSRFIEHRKQYALISNRA